MEHYILGKDRSIDLRDLQADARNQASIEFIEQLQKGTSLQIVTGSSPLPIKKAILEGYGSAFEWSCIKTGPKIWHAHVKRAA